jgi:beta-glucosidase
VSGHAKGKMSVTDAVAQSLIAGCDLSDAEYMKHIPAAVRQGLLPERRLNDAVYRVMRDRFRLGEFDPPEMVPFSRIPMSVICSPEHRRLSLRAAQESIVLLTNPAAPLGGPQGLLPLDRAKLKCIAVLGPHADRFTAGGYSGKAIDPVTPLAGIRSRAAAGTEILHAVGAEITPPRQEKGKPAPPVMDKQAALAQAVEAARKADVAIVCVGTTLEVEAEGRDRRTLALPGNQEELVKAVVAANPRTVVVELNAGPLAVPWIKEHAAAMVEMWWCGEEGGNALADVLLGTVNPAGRLPLTVYASDAQVPPQDEYDISKGFTYMYLKGQPLFPFGHGLSYTQFRYANLKVSPAQAPPDGEVTVTVDVTNTGPRPGEEVVQLYVHDVQCIVPRPIKELRGFERILLQPGQTKTVTFVLPAAKLAFYDERIHAFVVEPGAFDILIGASSADIRATGQVEVTK